MLFEINGLTVNKIHANTVKIHKRSNYQNDCSFTTRENTNIYEAGMEVVVTDGANIIFGGLIQQPKKTPLSRGQLNQDIESKGYKQLLTRRTASFDIENEYAGDAVGSLFDRFLADGTTYGEELTRGVISQGALISKDSGVKTFYKLFSSLAKASGYRMWITDDKEFYFTDKPSYVAITKVVTDDDSIIDSFPLMKPPTFKEDLSKYRNRQFAIGKSVDGSDLIGVAIDAAEEARMNVFYGSGVYGNIFTNDNMSTIEECDAAALAELQAYSVVPSTVEIETTDFIDVNQFVRVKLDMYGIDDAYVVDEVEISYDKTPKMLVYKAKLKRHIATAKQNSSWTDDWSDSMEETGGSNGASELAIANAKNDAVLSGGSFVGPGLDVVMGAKTDIAFCINITGTPSAPLGATLKVRLNGGEILETTKVMPLASLDSFSFTDVIPRQLAGTYTIDAELTTSTGTLTVPIDKYTMTLWVRGGATEEAPPYPSASVRDTFNVSGTVQTILSDWSDSVSTELDTSESNSIIETFDTSTIVSDIISTWSDTVESEVL